MGIASELENEIERLEGVVASRNQELARLRHAVEPFIKAAKIIAARPGDYAQRIALIGGLEDASDLMQRDFSRLLETVKQ